ncbi:hypothetical protein M409DRAFT_25494 [Zasmidium cellare ATCC 36951]|uniref:Uncharacterized protein n=1 Tax=Zasmidium cellare ATCC 36951 TaxID=1080233 RepID=A0A6A6CD93_ZASCE|nr:uncharacterized protein M409DRAFT_25494 [Zasmidium cellare ATCC 36951]KAF2164148.1 hypothetical protein M409DRAFT_25494 [Zasmidium cellare ATCC 36951]
MGYTHYWKIPGCHTAAWQRAWVQLVADTHHMIETAGIELCGNYLVENDRHEDLIPPLVSVEEGIAINGIEDDGHELFEMSRGIPRFQCCKTARKPYDVVVCCVLLRAWMLAPGCIEVSSDGRWDDELEWMRARELYVRVWPGDIIVRPPEIEEGC